MSSFAQLSSAIHTQLLKGVVIPAHPLALNADGTMNEAAQRRLTRYYMAAGAGGMAVGVHTTQFEIRQPQHNLYARVLQLAAAEADKSNNPLFIKVAGVCGPTNQAIEEATLALQTGYHLGLLSLGGLHNYSEAQLLTHVEAVAAIIPVFGFYLQPAVGGRLLSYDFWRKMADIPGVYAIKIAAFNRYQTIDVVRAVIESDRRNEIALYTGNDDNIVADLLTPYRFDVKGQTIEKYFCGGLLGHWAVWTSSAVTLLEKIQQTRGKKNADYTELLQIGITVTDMNAALFDVAHQFHGCIAGIHQILHQQGLLPSIRCLNPAETLSPGQLEELNRIRKAYPAWIDDDFVHTFIGSDTDRQRD